MKPKDIINETKKYLEPILQQREVELFDIHFIKEVNNWYLRIFIDCETKENGVDINDCEFVSRSIEKILDEKDYIEQTYILEVSSPGIDRPIRNEADFKRFAGELVEIKLFKSIEKQKLFVGKLANFTEEAISILLEDESTMDFDRKDVAVCKLFVTF